ncbi:MAG: hypothetical protein OES23_02525, partial [Nitrosopumilus sp.]|nr:hypothetical protein [Nitrosopumilus sp.]
RVNGNLWAHLTKLLFQFESKIFVKDIEFKLNSIDIHPNSEIKGTISVSYPGRYDGVVINTQILDSNEHIIYKSYNGKNISQNVSRLFINKDVMNGNKAEFTALINFEPKQEHEIKFRVSIIEQHKEIESQIIFAKYSI